MSVFDFAMGPALQASISIFLFFLIFRLAAMLTFHWRHNRAPSRGSVAAGALRTVFTRFWPMRDFRESTKTGYVLGYISHIGLAMVVLGGIFHIQFIKGLFGVSWPSLPPWIITTAALASLGAFIALLVRRLTNPVVRAMSNADDYISWFVTVLPLLTGLAMGFAGMSPGDYEMLLGIHVLSFELLLIWLPLGKLIHTFSFLPSRAMTGATYGQRGVKA